MTHRTDASTRLDRAEDKLAAAMAALRQAERDLQRIVNDDDLEVDPAFALRRVQDALTKLDGVKR